MTAITSKRRLEIIIQRLREMRLPIMADQLQLFSQKLDTNSQKTLDRLEIMVNEEYQTRKENTGKRYRKQAKLYQNQATLSKIDYKAERKINAQVVDQLSTNDYIVQTLLFKAQLELARPIWLIYKLPKWIIKCLKH